MSGKITYRCPQCRADESALKFHATERWNVERQAWDTVRALGTCFCSECNKAGRPAFVTPVTVSAE